MCTLKMSGRRLTLHKQTRKLVTNSLKEWNFWSVWSQECIQIVLFLWTKETRKIYLANLALVPVYFALTSLLMRILLGKVPISPQSDNSCLGTRSRTENRKSPLSERPGWTQTCVSKFMSTSKIVFTFGSAPKSKLLRISRLNYFRMKQIYKELAAKSVRTQKMMQEKISRN